MSTITKRWTIEDFRGELRRLDERSGFNSENVQIVLINRKNPVAYFSREPLSFGFSAKYFNDPTFSESQALETIAHEYAHFLVYEQYGDTAKRSHGAEWHQACRMIGTLPLHFYNESMSKTIDKLRSQSTPKYYYLCIVEHKTFGRGIVEDVHEGRPLASYTVKFDNGDRRKIREDYLESRFLRCASRAACTYPFIY